MTRGKNRGPSSLIQRREAPRGGREVGRGDEESHRKGLRALDPCPASPEMDMELSHPLSVNAVAVPPQWPRSSPSASRHSTQHDSLLLFPFLDIGLIVIANAKRRLFFSYSHNDPIGPTNPKPSVGFSVGIPISSFSGEGAEWRLRMTRPKPWRLVHLIAHGPWRGPSWECDR